MMSFEGGRQNIGDPCVRWEAKAIQVVDVCQTTRGNGLINRQLHLIRRPLIGIIFTKSKQTFPIYDTQNQLNRFFWASVNSADSTFENAGSILLFLHL
jgi:hypothetical protein